MKVFLLGGVSHVLWAVALFLLLDARVSAQPPARGEAAAARGKVYGEWLIRVRPDKGAEYDKLIETRGLPLFREAGGRMVGWWKTLIGDLYEHVTIWEYDSMAAFEQAVQFLGPNERFGEFVQLRDPLLTGEESRFMRLTPGAEAPSLPDAAKFVVHEIHRVPVARQQEYLQFMQQQGLAMLQKHGFRPAGPWSVEMGRWSEVTYLFRFESLAERDRLIAKFSSSPEAQAYNANVNAFAAEITTRLLLPAPFALPAKER